MVESSNVTFIRTHASLARLKISTNSSTTCPGTTTCASSKSVFSPFLSKPCFSRLILILPMSTLFSTDTSDCAANTGYALANVPAESRMPSNVAEICILFLLISTLLFLFPKKGRRFKVCLLRGIKKLFQNCRRRAAD